MTDLEFELKIARAEVETLRERLNKAELTIAMLRSDRQTWFEGSAQEQQQRLTDIEEQWMEAVRCAALAEQGEY